MLNLTVVICTFNSEPMIEACLQAVRQNDPAVILLVDAGSTDRTREIARPLVHEIIDDNGRGLANARNMGIDWAKTEYICFVGPDNLMPAGSLARMIAYLNDHDCAIVSAVTVLRDTASYLGWAQNIYRIRKYTPGFKEVVGTPTLFRTAVARKYKYNPYMKNSDDTEICSRMAADGLKFAISDTVCQEIGFDDLASVVERWTRYGRGDYLFYETQKSSWGLLRKLQSLVHPFHHDFLVVVARLRWSELGCVLFLMFIVCLRYYGWFKSRLLQVENRASVHGI